MMTFDSSTSYRMDSWTRTSDGNWFAPNNSHTVSVGKRGASNPVLIMHKRRKMIARSSHAKAIVTGFKDGLYWSWPRPRRVSSHLKLCFSWHGTSFSPPSKQWYPSHTLTVTCHPACSSLFPNSRPSSYKMPFFAKSMHVGGKPWRFPAGALPGITTHHACHQSMDSFLFWHLSCWGRIYSQCYRVGKYKLFRLTNHHWNWCFQQILF